MKYSAIVCVDKNYGIGRDGQLMMRIKNDMRHFKTITTLVENCEHRNVVIMGRKTWDSIPDNYKPLEGRINVVISTTLQDSLNSNDVIVCRSPEEAERIIPTLRSIANVYVIGGASIYTYFMPKYTRIYLTQIITDLSISADTFFPRFDKDLFDNTYTSGIIKVQSNREGVIEYRFETYVKKF